MHEACENNYYTPPQMLRNQYMPISCQYLITYQNQETYQQRPAISNPNWRPEFRSQSVLSQNPTYLNILENLNLGNINGNIPGTENITNSQNLIQTIPPAIVTEDSSLTVIFFFELEEKKAMFSEAALDEECPITAMYIEAKVNNMSIKLILDSRFARSIVML
ncbi:hypothetical protein G9A89_011403 [Geosiphon pyriformis]|nr:hypothetical protein G9A89_011403 [Geosiphon pyriformis]